jgi:hypothetical protein
VRYLKSAIAVLTVPLLAAAAAAPAGAAKRKAYAPLGPVAFGILVSPQSGTPDAAPLTQISILGPRKADIAHVKVVGSRSGRHRGRLRAYRAKPGASFVPSKPFQPGEQVGVSFNVKGARSSHVAYHFTVGTPGTPTVPIQAPPPADLRLNAQSYQTRPDLHPTNFTVTTRTAGVAPGYEFVAPIRGPGPTPGPMFGQYGPLILDGNGQPVWFKPMPTGLEAFDFSAQTYRGAPVLTWWQGQLSPVGVGAGVGVIMDEHYRQLATVRGGNGLIFDLHEFLLTPKGTALLTAYEPLTRDLSAYGGMSRATMWDSVIQEIDIKTGLVMWEWHALGHVDPADSFAPIQPNMTWDPFHINSLQPLPNGNLVASFRDTSTIYQINPLTGHLIWRLGGKRSTFALGPGARFNWQHDARLAADNTISVFDNEALPAMAPQSRGLVLKLDYVHRAASVVREYLHSQPSVLAGSQGDTQMLPNGNALVGWGAGPFLSEFDPAGNVVFDGHFVAPVESYRSYRFPWTGRPTSRPTIVAHSAGATATTVSVSWNGATDVASWQFLAGPDPAALSIAGSAPKNGLETSLTVNTTGPYFAVRALTASGRVLAQSGAAKVS